LWHDLLYLKRIEHRFSQNSCYIAVEQKMVDGFPALLVRVTLVHHNDLSLSQVIQGQDFS
jgi:hypothetical protein